MQKAEKTATTSAFCLLRSAFSPPHPPTRRPRLLHPLQLFLLLLLHRSQQRLGTRVRLRLLLATISRGGRRLLPPFRVLRILLIASALLLHGLFFLQRDLEVP